MNKKNFLTILVSTSLSIVICYFLFFLHIYNEELHKHPFLFKSIDTLNFNKNYYDKLHHLREIDGRWEVEGKPQIYLFSTIKKFSNGSKNVLFQGDSWIQQINEINYENSYKLLHKFAEENNFGIINAGVASFSPSLMQLQFEILEKDFNFKPDIVVAYIDQTDFGDELCRYKHNRVYDENNILIAVKKENYSRAVYEHTKIFNISEITLLHDSTLTRTLKLTNFFIKYGFLRFIEKTKFIKKEGWKNRSKQKCAFREIRKYLVKSNAKEILYFESRVNDYINFLLNKQYVEKIILVTFPHHDHLFGYTNLEGKREYYKVNVSDIVEKKSKNNKKVYHLNFSKLISEGEINLDKNSFVDNDPGSHLKGEYHSTVFVQEIINLLK